MTRVVHDLVEDALRELADESSQRDLWLASGGPLVSSFIECTSRLWDDSGLADELDRQNIVYTAAIDERLRDLREVLRGIDGSRAPLAILDDPSLRRARSMAQNLLRSLTQLGYEDATR